MAKGDKGDKGEVKISLKKGGIKGIIDTGIKFRRNLNQAINDLQQAKKLANKAIRLSQGRLTEKAEDKIANSLKFIGKAFHWNQVLERKIDKK